jgi:hypothetical protein
MLLFLSWPRQLPVISTEVEKSLSFAEYHSISLLLDPA